MRFRINYHRSLKETMLEDNPMYLFRLHIYPYYIYHPGPFIWVDSVLCLFDTLDSVPNNIICFFASATIYMHKFSVYRKVIGKIDQTEFEGFEYVNPLLMSQEDCV